jgi:hypothetical protein
MEGCREVGRFLVATVNHWVTLVTGGIVTALVFLYTKWRNQDLEPGSYLSLLGIFVVIASFLAWRDQYRKGQRLEKALAKRFEAVMDEDCPTCRSEIGPGHWMLRLGVRVLGTPVDALSVFLMDVQPRAIPIALPTKLVAMNTRPPSGIVRGFVSEGHAFHFDIISQDSSAYPGQVELGILPLDIPRRLPMGTLRLRMEVVGASVTLPVEAKVWQDTDGKLRGELTCLSGSASV